MFRKEILSLAFQAIVVVHSAPKNFEEREGIRHMWMHTAISSGKIGVVFILGKIILGFANFGKFGGFLYVCIGNSGDEEVDAKVIKEAGEHNDILKEDFIDSYHNLTIKTTMMLKFFYLNKFDVKLIFKASLLFVLSVRQTGKTSVYPIFKVIYLLPTGKTNVLTISDRRRRLPQHPRVPAAPADLGAHQRRGLQQSHVRPLVPHHPHPDDHDLCHGEKVGRPKVDVPAGLLPPLPLRSRVRWGTLYSKLLNESIKLLPFPLLSLFRKV